MDQIDALSDVSSSNVSPPADGEASPYPAGDVTPVASASPPFEESPRQAGDASPYPAGDVTPVASANPPLEDSLHQAGDASPYPAGDVTPVANASPPLEESPHQAGDASPYPAGDVSPVASASPPFAESPHQAGDASPHQAGVDDILDFLSDGSEVSVVHRDVADEPRQSAPAPHGPGDILDLLRRFKWGVNRKSITRKLVRERARAARMEADAAHDRTSIAAVWARNCLARGERLTTTRGAVKRRRKKDDRPQWQHARAWTLQGTQQVAFSSIGQLAPNAKGLRKTRREVCAIAACAIAHKDFRNERAADAFRYMSSGALPVTWLVVERALDATPCKVTFGKLHPLLAPVARYWWRDDVPKSSGTKRDAAGLQNKSPEPSWTTISHAEWMRRKKGKEPRSGTLELLGQSLRCSWAPVTDQASGGGVVITESPVVEPVYLARANAATLLAALELTCPFVALEKLMGLSEKIPRICLINSSDLCPANARMKHAIAYKLAVHNAASLSRGGGIILFVDVHCSSHVLHNIVEKAFALHLFIPRMHSIAFSLSIPRTYAQVFRLLRTLVEHDLALGFFPDTKPPAQHQASTETIVDMTLLRHRTTRGRTDSMDDAAYDVRLGEVAIVIKDLLNGDWAQPRLQHYCWKPGASPAPPLHHPPPTTPHTTPHHTKPTPPPGARHPTRTLPPPHPSITPHCHAISAAPAAPPHHTHPTPARFDAEALCCFVQDVALGACIFEIGVWLLSGYFQC